jgi:hypothetical protein
MRLDVRGVDGKLIRDGSRTGDVLKQALPLAE